VFFWSGKGLLLNPEQMSFAGTAHRKWVAFYKVPLNSIFDALFNSAMRLGQLARKIDISPTEIEQYLYANGTFIEAGSNSKLEDSAVHRVISHFAPHLMAEVDRELEAEHQQEATPKETPVVTEPSPVVDQSPAEPAEKPEVIKAPKVELQGLKVLGKIELPEPKKKPEPEREEREQHHKRERNRREERTSRPWVNKLELQRQQEAKEAEAIKREEARQEKERRALAYYSRQEKVSRKPQRKTRDESAPASGTAPSKPVQQPRTLLGKVWRWLTQAE